MSTLLWISLQTNTPHVFSYRADSPLQSVHVAGTFNNWDKQATPLVPDADRMVWTKRVPLGVGKHLYKFVLDGETWITDPRSVRNEDDGGGNVNSVLVVLPLDYGQPAVRGDGKIAMSALRHVAEVPDRNLDHGRLHLSLRARPGDIQRVELLTGGRTVPLEPVANDGFYARYSCSLPWDGKRPLSYVFRCADGERTVFVGPGGATSVRGDVFSISRSSFKPFVVPSWVERSVIYQVFPDRFANGDRRNDPQGVVPWDAKPTWSNRFGGDVAGVRSKKAYFESLGVGAIYFNPVFQSPSNHRYETTDYRLIDRDFGTNAEFSSMTRDFASDGIRTVLDGVFNHTAVDFAAFADIRAKGAASKYRGWYFVHSYPVTVGEHPNYDAWFGFPSMPKLNLANPDVRALLLDVPRFWHEGAKIAGWRLDVANEVPMDYWRAFRRRVKALDPQAWIVGEVWGAGTPWLKGDQWDSVMNYRFREANLGFLARQSTTGDQFLKALMDVYLGDAPQVSRNMMNLLSSHDTPRFLTLCGGNEARARLGALVQFTWVGAPSVYYGEELGMTGQADPDNRRGMDWSRATPGNRTLRWYRALGALRGATPALQSGDPIPLASTADAVAYGRTLGTTHVLVALNRSTAKTTLKVPLNRLSGSASYVDALTGTHATPRRGVLTLSLAPQTGVVLLPGNAKSKAVASSIIRILGSKEPS